MMPLQGVHLSNARLCAGLMVMVSSLESNSFPRIISDINHSSQWNGAVHAGIQPVYHQLLFFRHKKCLEEALIGAAQRFDFNFTLNYFWHGTAKSCQIQIFKRNPEIHQQTLPLR